MTNNTDYTDDGGDWQPAGFGLEAIFVTLSLLLFLAIWVIFA